MINWIKYGFRIEYYAETADEYLNYCKKEGLDNQALRRLIDK
jgi:hypothetical protein